MAFICDEPVIEEVDHLVPILDPCGASDRVRRERCALHGGPDQEEVRALPTIEVIACDSYANVKPNGATRVLATLARPGLDLDRALAVSLEVARSGLGAPVVAISRDNVEGFG